MQKRLRGETTRTMIFAPPRHGKSELLSYYFPSCWLGNMPDDRVILLSYEASFAANWGKRVRNLLEEYGQSIYGVQISDDTAAKDDWGIRGRSGGMVTAGAGGGVMGRGAHLFIIDDPIKNFEEATSDHHKEKLWQTFQSTISTRLMPGGAIVLDMQRWVHDDPAGRILAEQGDRWDVVSLPAIATEDELDEDGQPFRSVGDALWPFMWPKERLEREIKQTRDAFWWESQYQQNAGNFSTAAWPLEYFEGDDIWFRDWPSELRWSAIALDPSKGVKGDKVARNRLPDYSAFVKLGIGYDDKLYVEGDLDRYRPAEKIVADGVEHWIRFPANLLVIESNAWQDLLAPLFVSAFRERGIFDVPMELVNHGTKKEVRILSLGPLLAAREVKFKRNSPGTMILFEQLKNFRPGGGSNDDGPDALEMGVDALRRLAIPMDDGLGDRLRGVNIR